MKMIMQRCLFIALLFWSAAVEAGSWLDVGRDDGTTIRGTLVVRDIQPDIEAAEEPSA